MKKQYIQPSAKVGSVELNNQILATSTIGFGPDTNSYDAKGTMDDDQDAKPWYRVN